MSFYKDQDCPVCKKKFTEDDDIVSCPHCGTPHHRKCYNELSHCVNESLHGTDFSYRKALKKAEAAQIEAEKQYYGKDIPEGFERPVSLESFRRAQEIYHSPENTAKRNAEERISGCPVSDIKAVVSTNAARFLPVFRKAKKIGWNWAAFFFGPYYLLFRKMYYQGMLFMTARFATQLIIQTIFYKELLPFFQNYSDFIRGTAELNQSLYQTALPALLLILAVYLVINTIIAMIADHFYRNKVFSVISKFDRQVNDGTISQQDFMMTQHMNISRGDFRRYCLSKMGGVTLLAPMAAYFLLDLVNMVLVS